MDERFTPDRAVDGDPATRWGCDPGVKSAWLEVDLGSSQAFNRASISEGFDRVKRFELQVWESDAWRTIQEGQTIGEHRELSFPVVSAQRVRLNLAETTEAPSIWEFQLFGPNSRSAPQP